MSAVILLYVPNATSEQIEYGIQVALAVLEQRSVSPESARRAAEACRGFNASPVPKELPDDDTVKAWLAYDAARWAAVEACREGATGEAGWTFEIVLKPMAH